MKTRYFTLGQGHTHVFNGITLDRNSIVKITDENPREKMFEFFGDRWCFEYEECPDLIYFPRGVFNINTSKFDE